MVRNYVRKTDSGRAPKKELALLSKEDRTERLRSQNQARYARWKAKQALAKKKAQR